MSIIQPKGEEIRQAVKWISTERLEAENKANPPIVQEAALKFNLSPEEEQFLVAFCQENQD